MEPNEAAEIYLKQAMKLFDFMEKIKQEECTNEQYKMMLLVICQKYYELLVSLSVFTPMLSSYNVKLFKIKAYNLEEPPFEKDFFLRHPI